MKYEFTFINETKRELHASFAIPAPLTTQIEAIEGVSGIFPEDKYCLSIRIARMFDRNEVMKKVTDLVEAYIKEAQATQQDNREGDAC